MHFTGRKADETVAESHLRRPGEGPAPKPEEVDTTILYVTTMPPCYDAIKQLCYYTTTLLDPRRTRSRFQMAPAPKPEEVWGQLVENGARLLCYYTIPLYFTRLHPRRSASWLKMAPHLCCCRGTGPHQKLGRCHIKTLEM